MLHFKSNSVKGYKNMDIPYTILSKTDAPKGLAIIFPGAGYTVQSPLLHYSTGALLAKSFDVLHVDFPYNNTFYDDFTAEKFNEAVLFDSKAVVDNVLAENIYDEFYLIGKSIGTIALSSELKRSVFQSAKVVWLTPLLQKDEVFNAMVTSKNKGLCVIGDKDLCYVVERFNQILQNPDMTSKLIPNVNHILEYDDDVFGSIDILRYVITEIDQF
jgi:hypothetical protein